MVTTELVAAILHGRRLITAITTETKLGNNISYTIPDISMFPLVLGNVTLKSLVKGRNRITAYDLETLGQVDDFWNAFYEKGRETHTECAHLWLLDDLSIISVFDKIDVIIAADWTEGWRSYYRSKFVPKGESGAFLNHQKIDRHLLFEIINDNYMPVETRERWHSSKPRYRMTLTPQREIQCVCPER